MERHDLDPARLAAAILYLDDGPYSEEGRRTAFRRAYELYAALEDAQVSETSLAMAIHGARCGDTRSGQFHEWSYHRPEAGDLLGAVADPELDAKLARHHEHRGG